MSRQITQNQIDYINALTHEMGLWEIDISDIIYSLFDILCDIEGLTSEQASELIDELKDRKAVGF